MVSCMGSCAGPLGISVFSGPSAIDQAHSFGLLSIILSFVSSIFTLLAENLKCFPDSSQSDSQSDCSNFKCVHNAPAQASAPWIAGFCGLQAVAMLWACPASGPAGTSKAGQKRHEQKMRQQHMMII